MVCTLYNYHGSQRCMSHPTACTRQFGYWKILINGIFLNNRVTTWPAKNYYFFIISPVGFFFFGLVCGLFFVGWLFVCLLVYLFWSWLCSTSHREYEGENLVIMYFNCKSICCWGGWTKQVSFRLVHCPVDYFGPPPGCFLIINAISSWTVQ